MRDVIVKYLILAKTMSLVSQIYMWIVFWL